MTDSTLNRFIAYGTNAQRLAFTPSVPTPASGPSQAYVWYETDTGLEYTYASGAWHLIGSTTVGNVSGPASSTDRAVATWNSTGGVLLRDNSAVTIDASGNITTSGKATITGNVSGGNLTTAGNVTGANIGNITSTNFNGNGSTVLLGNGTFGVVPSGSGGAFTLIGTATPSGAGNNTVTFSSIPTDGTYKHLYVLASGRSDVSATSAFLDLTFNNDTAANYEWQISQSSNTTFSGSQSLTPSNILMGTVSGATSTAGVKGYGEAHIYDYPDTNLFKICKTSWGDWRASGSGNMTITEAMGCWKSSVAINRIDVILSAGNFTAGSRVSLYGLA